MIAFYSISYYKFASKGEIFMKLRLFFGMLLLTVHAARADSPAVLVSIAPLHSVVAAVADGVFVPDLLLNPAVSVHEYRLKPSDLRKIAAADVVFYGGATLESFLPKVLEATGTKSVSFIDGGDPHFWLSPPKMADIAQKTAQELAKLDPEHTETYRRNADGFAALATRLTERGRRDLENVKNKPFVVFHDAYSEFAREFNLHGIGAVLVDAHRGTGAAHLSELREKIRESGKVCLFSEPQLSSSAANAVREGLDVVDAAADPLGANIPAGKDFYPRLIENLVSSFRYCLSRI